MPPEGSTTFNFQQLPQQQQQPQLQYQQVRQALPSTSASSVTRVSTPGPHIYDISSINNMYGCGGGQPPGIGGHRHYYDINQLNREHLRDLPRGLLRHWGILCDTGAVTSVAHRNFEYHVPLHPHKFSLSTATNQPIHIYGYKDFLLICNNITLPVRLYICDIKAPLLGLHDIFDSGIILHINGKDSSTIEHQGETELLYHHRSHLFVDAMAFDIDHKMHQHWVHYIQQHGFDSDRRILMSEIGEPQHLAREAQQPQSLHSPTLPSQAEQDTHSLTHQLFRSWCRVCQQAKGRGGQHRRQHQQDENVRVIQLDCTFMHDPHQPPQRSGEPHTYTIRTVLSTVTSGRVTQSVLDMN